MPHGALFDYRVDQISKTGVCGRPTKASKELGEKIMNARVDAISRWIENALKEEVPFKDKVDHV
jgi:creatinine amidohydrolase/Fe(II)-dependent formamide hydrolase-like protein